jgi:HD-GYP domain-containing protein (c-di-GMP phosphodiesterase class II)
MSRVAEYAGAHHETLDGKGYPRGLTAEQLSIPARILAIADIFEALTASDRPYKKGMPVSQAIRILVDFRDRRCIDPDLVDLFLRSGAWRAYAEAYLKPEQIDIEQADVERFTTASLRPVG